MHNHYEAREIHLLYFRERITKFFPNVPMFDKYRDLIRQETKLAMWSDMCENQVEINSHGTMALESPQIGMGLHRAE